MVRVRWDRAFRLIRSLFPPIDLFEDIGDPRDWDALASLESKTNPRVFEELGQLDLVPVGRRVGGAGATYVMAPFVHCSTDRPGRFSTGEYGIYSCADAEEVAIREVAFHHERFMRRTCEGPGWASEFRMLVGDLDADLDDLRGRADVHNPDSWAIPQLSAAALRVGGSDGVLYNSVRSPGGLCAGLFWPDVPGIPVQTDHYAFHWNGETVDRIYNKTQGQELAM